jgi:hypothetical protein
MDSTISSIIDKMVRAEMKPLFDAKFELLDGLRQLFSAVKEPEIFDLQKALYKAEGLINKYNPGS